MISNFFYHISSPHIIGFSLAFTIAIIANLLFMCSKKEYRFEMITSIMQFACAISMINSDNLINIAIFYELISVFAIITIFRKKPNYVYCLTHIFSGMMLISGIGLHMGGGNSPLIHEFHHLGSLSDFLILGSLLINLGAYPFSFILVNGYHNAPAHAINFLAVFSTKASIFLLLMMFSNHDFLIYVGILMILYATIYGIFENNILKILCYMVVGQLGFLITAIGVGGDKLPQIINLQVLSSTLYQQLLFLCSYLIIQNSKKSNISEIGGYFKSMKITYICMIIGCFSLSAFPFTAGFISKAALFDIVEKNLLVKIIFMIGSVGTIIMLPMRFIYNTNLHFRLDTRRTRVEERNVLKTYMSYLKIPIVRQRDNQSEVWYYIFKKKIPKHSISDPVFLQQIPIIMLASLNIIIGFFPSDAFRQYHLLKQFYLLLCSGIIFAILLPVFNKIRLIDIDDILKAILQIRFNFSMASTKECIKKYMGMQNSNDIFKNQLLKYFEHINGILISYWIIAIIIICSIFLT